LGNQTFLTKPNLSGVAGLIAAVPKAGFGKAVLDYICLSGSIENFGAYYFSDLTRPKPVLSVWSGRISDYWFQRNAKAILDDPDIRNALVQTMRAAPDDGVSIERWLRTKRIRGALFSSEAISWNASPSIPKMERLASCPFIFATRKKDGFQMKNLNVFWSVCRLCMV